MLKVSASVGEGQSGKWLVAIRTRGWLVQNRKAKRAEIPYPNVLKTATPLSPLNRLEPIFSEDLSERERKIDNIYIYMYIYIQYI